MLPKEISGQDTREENRTDVSEPAHGDLLWKTQASICPICGHMMFLVNGFYRCAVCGYKESCC